MIGTITITGLIIVLGLGALGARIVRPTQRGLIERLGRYHKFASPGFHYIIPIVDRMVVVNVTEMMSSAEPQEIITKDKLNAMVDAQVYYKVKDDEESVKASQYSVNNYSLQIVQLSRTTLRNIIGSMTLNDANSDRDKINSSLMATLTKETKTWGIEVVRTELKEINPPKTVQETMNKVVIAENEKQASIDFAKATETRADGEKMAKIKIAEADKQASILRAEGQAKGFDLIQKSFVDNAQKLKQLETLQACLENNTKVVITEKGISPTLIMDAITVKTKKGGDGE